ncbi:MAG: hypothetical protein ACTSYC_00600 [Promethearchaeota archaeon]
MSKENPLHVNVLDDPPRKILEIISLLRVMNYYYKKKRALQKELKPKILQKFREGMKSLEESDWLFIIPLALDALTEEFASKKDSFRFPDSILLFEAWMNLGFDALYPQYVLHFKFPGILKGEKYRHLFQFIFSTSRGFGFPIMFSPQFYHYESKIYEILDPLFKWVYTVCHKANQAISLVGNKFKITRHHPGEFEAVILSEYQDKNFKVFDTLLHGYYASSPKKLGKYPSIKEALKNVMFSYTIGDHAMSLHRLNTQNIRTMKLISNEEILTTYDVDFYSYVQKLLNLSNLIKKQIIICRHQRNRELNQFSFLEILKFRFTKVLNKIRKIPYKKEFYPKKFASIIQVDHSIHLLEDLKDLLFDSPLYTHTIHDPKKNEKIYTFLTAHQEQDFFLEKQAKDSILLAYITFFEKKYNISFDIPSLIKELQNLRDHMAKMWLYFRERQFNLATRKINELSSLSIDSEDYEKDVKNRLNTLIPIISIYEIFHRSLAESVYPESISQSKRMGAFIARFFAFKYNPIGISLMNLFNRLAFQNWSYFIIKRRLNLKKFYQLIVKLPLWEHIPPKIKKNFLRD